MQTEGVGDAIRQKHPPFLLAQFQKDQLMAGAFSPLLVAAGISFIRQAIINITREAVV